MIFTSEPRQGERVRRLLVAGDIEQGRLCAEALLESAPDDADTLHWHGVASMLAGADAQALASLTRAAVLAPAQPIYSNNLAEALRRSGDNEAAVRAADQALLVDPDYLDARINRAAALFACGRHREALSDYGIALRRKPHDASLIAFRADCLRELGDWHAARRAYLGALRRDPDLAHAHANLGPLLLLLGESQQAFAHCERAVALAGDGDMAWMNLARCHLDLEQLDEAMSAYARAFECAPQSAELCCCIGEVWQQVGDYEQAGLWFERAHERESRPGSTTPESGSPRLKSCLAALLAESGNSEQAVQVYRELRDAWPNEVRIALGLGRALWDEGDVTGALESYRHAAALRPQMAQVYCCIADVLLSIGDLAGAQAQQRAALAINPRCVGALAGLATGLRGALPPEDAQAAENLLVQPWLRDGARSALHAGLAHHNDGAGNHARAALHATQGNRLYWAHRSRQGWHYDPGEHAAQVDRLIATFTPELFARLGSAGSHDPRPIFIVGMPRSGTTLTEQILASHPSMLGIGERPFAARSLQRVPAIAGPGGSPLAAIARLDARGLQQIAAEYGHTLDIQMEKCAGPSTPVLRVIDKMPDNYELLGWTALLFPQARLIYVRRDPRDIALSCWMQRFGQIRWACDMQHIAQRLVQHHRLMAHWRRVLPIPLFEFDYEALVADVEGVSRQLVASVGLEWDEACLGFADHRNVVRTASVSQVRRPAYTSSIARWRHYQEALAPVLEIFPEWPATQNLAAQKLSRLHESTADSGVRK